MRHFKEWEAKRSFVVDEYDLNLCRLVMDIQFYSQNYYFGKMAEMYFEEKTKNAIASRTKEHGEVVASYFNAMPEQFTRENLISQASVSESNAGVLLHRWKQEGLVEIVRKPKCRVTYKKQKRRYDGQEKENPTRNQAE